MKGETIFWVRHSVTSSLAEFSSIEIYMIRYHPVSRSFILDERCGVRNDISGDQDLLLLPHMGEKTFVEIPAERMNCIKRASNISRARKSRKYQLGRQLHR